MGPCLFRHGNLNMIQGRIILILASMGPCLFRHGNNDVGLEKAEKEFQASMGPCLFRHGNIATTSNILPMTGLQWGRAFSGTEIPFCLELTAAPMLQWGRAFSGTEMESKRNFRKCNIIASMGPCLFRHGNTYVLRR